MKLAIWHITTLFVLEGHISLGFTILGEIFACVTVFVFFFNPAIEESHSVFMDGAFWV